MSLSILDVQAPFDLTAFSEITFAQLQQWLSGTTPFQDKGMIGATADVGGIPSVPNATNATGEPKWQNYIWLRVGSSIVTPYVWNPNVASDPILLNWVPASSYTIPPGSITGSQIALNTITAANVSYINLNQVNGYSLAISSGNTWTQHGVLQDTTAYPSGVFLSGTLGSPSVSAGSIIAAYMASQSVAGSSTALAGTIVDNSVTTLQLKNNGGTQTSSAQQQSNAAVDPQYNMMVSNKSLVGTPSGSNFSLSASGIASTPGDLLGVNYDSTGAQAGFIQIRKSITVLTEPTASLATNQIPYVPAETVASDNIVPYSFSSFQGAMNSQPVGRMMQFLQTSTTTKTSTSGNLANNSSAPNANATGMTALLSQAITPINAGSTIRLQFSGTIISTADAGIFVGVYTGTGAVAPIGGCALQWAASITPPMTFDLFLTNQGTSALTYYVRFGTTAGAASFNTLDGTNSFGGGIMQTVLTVTELF